MPDKIQEAKDKAVKELNKHINEMSSISYNIYLNLIEQTFDIKGGKIVADKNFIKQLNKLTNLFIDLLQTEPKFTGPVSKFIRQMPEISNAISDFQKQTNGIKVPAFEVEKKIVVDEIIDKMLNNGLNQNFAQPLRDLLYQNVTQGLSLSDARQQIKEFISGGKDVSGKLGQYIEQTSQQAVNSYSGIIGSKLMETFNYNAMSIVGPLIDTSSPQCIYSVKELKRIIKRSDWPEVKKIAKNNGLVEGTEFNDLPMNLLHWGCNHDFYPMIIKKSA